MQKTCLLNGWSVSVEVIDSAKHKFIGTFRSPFPPNANGYLQCPCGDMLKIMGEEFTHWQRGHFDVPQYQTIEKNDPLRKNNQS